MHDFFFFLNGIFCRTESVAMTPKSRDHMPTTSLWGVAAKWPTRAPKTKLILCPREPQGKSTGTSCQLRSKPHAVFYGVCEIALTEVSARYTNGRDAAQQESQLV